MNALMLAHQGGWDEMALVLAPVAVVGVLLKLANRRAQRLLAEQEQGGTAVQAQTDPAPRNES
ncbi:MAG: hypothetical protein QOJ19_4085 [Acidimicrobiia bacterium]|jgi:hypothetical protein|nr:hypothetical protein [Acidimicrobiia bacterium]